MTATDFDDVEENFLHPMHEGHYTDYIPSSIRFSSNSPTDPGPSTSNNASHFDIPDDSPPPMPQEFQNTSSKKIVRLMAKCGLKLQMLLCLLETLF